MVFSSLVFLCFFLPVTFCLHSVIPSIKIRNILLIIASLIFYAYGEPVYVLLMVASSFLNYLFAYLMGRGRKKFLLVLAIVVNVGVLCGFKYTGFIVETINSLTGAQIPVPLITLPIGISFFTFQALSYVIDVYRGNTSIQKNYSKVLLYISFFPQLIAGPIVKYRDIEREISGRKVIPSEAALGLRRFIFGLAKKVLIANTMAVAADYFFADGAVPLNAAAAWIGAVAYAMQIYFDFSGYSDMAIGMGRMFGFHFKENFDHPYLSVSIKEFWRRWHISLSSWFKDYVYIPLGGNRKGKARTWINKFIVFFLTGLWHGANWTFVIWGLFHGFFSSLEDGIKRLQRLPRVLGHIYTMLVVIIGFVIFRADNLGYAFSYIGKMFSGSDFSSLQVSHTVQQLTPFFIVMLVAAVFFCGPAQSIAEKIRRKSGDESVVSTRAQVLQSVLFVIAAGLLLWCIIRLSGGAYNPFIYFRF